ncbi:hypothetical protein [Pseudooceanicola sp. MF1-13]|uniref:hypothetical protein n=1 Tax=Pseudooceanicola sp. MF1-13 TaxID=3379095 RepID=UPI003891E094
MANATKGQKAVEAGGQTYIIEFSANGFCELEDATGKSTMQFLTDLDAQAQAEDVRFKDVRLLFWAGLQEHHEGLSQRDAGRIMKEVGGFEKAMTLIQDAVTLALPQAPDDTGQDQPGSEGGANPPTATA